MIRFIDFLKLPRLKTEELLILRFMSRDLDRNHSVSIEQLRCNRMSDTMINTADLEARLSEATTLEQRLAAFGEILEVARPVSKQVLFGALQDPT